MMKRSIMRDGGEEIAPNLHPLLAAALAALPESERPPGPYHLDGPRPRLTVQGIAEVAELCAQHVRPRARGDANECDRLLHLLRKAVVDEGPPDAAWRVDLRGARTIREHSRGVLKIIALACEASHEDALRAIDRLSTAISLAMRALDPEERVALVRALDRRIVLSEATDLARRAGLTTPVTDVVAREDGRVLVAHDRGLASWLVREPSGCWTSCTDALTALRPSPSIAPDRARVSHPRFGEGEVLERREGPPAKLEVRFADRTIWLLEDRVTWISGARGLSDG